jgi:tetratricopeptide (TPR) repeat protein
MWTRRPISSAGVPTGWKGEGEELEKFGINLDIGDEPIEVSSIYTRGAVMRPSNLTVTIKLGNYKDAPTAWDDRDWNGEFLSLLEEPLFTPQDVRTKQQELNQLRAAFVKRHFRTVQILVQERTFKFHYKSIKPIVSTSCSFGYVCNNAFFKVQHDTMGRFFPNERMATSHWLKQEMNSAANAMTASQTVISSPLFALVDYCGVRILISSIVPGAPWTDDFIEAEKEYANSIENQIAPKELSYRWKAAESIKRSQQNINPPIAITPSELMQLTVGKSEYILRIRFRIWKNRIQALKHYLHKLMCKRDHDVMYSLREVGTFNLWRNKNHENENNSNEKESLRGTIGIDRDIEILRGSDCRYYIASCRTLLPPLAPLNVVSIVAKARKKEKTGVSLPWELPTPSLVAKLLPQKTAEPEILISVPWYSMSDPSELIKFVEKHIGPAHETGGYIETRAGDLMFWQGAKRISPNIRASSFAQRELSGNAIILPQYTATQAWYRWRDESFRWRRTNNNMTTIHPSVFRFPTSCEIPKPKVNTRQQSSPNKRRRRGSAVAQAAAAAAQTAVVPKNEASIKASKILSMETLSFLEHACFAVSNDLTILINKNIQKKGNAISKVGDIRPFKIISTFHKHGLPIRYIGLVRLSTKSDCVKEALLEEATARVFKHFLASVLRNLSCFVSDNTAEDPMKHLGKSTEGSCEEDDIYNWFEHHQHLAIARGFNLLLGHADGTGKVSDDWSSEQKIQLMLKYPSILTNDELLMDDIYKNVLTSETSRVRLFKRAQELTGCTFFRHLSGNKKVKTSYIESLEKKCKYPKRLFKAISCTQDVKTTLKRLNTKRMTLEVNLGQEHPLHLQILNRIASVHSVTAKGLNESERLYALSVDLAQSGHGTSSSAYVNALLAQGEFLSKIGKYHQALIPLNKAKRGLDGALGVQLARVYRSIGLCTMKLGLLISGQEEGEKCIENSKQIMDDVFGYGKPEIVTSYLLAAELMCLVNRTEEAGIVLAKAQDTCQCSLGVHPDHAHCFFMKAMLGLTIGEYKDCLSQINTAHLMYKDTLGCDSLEYKDTSILKARIQLRFGDFIGMSKSIDKAEEITKHRLSEDKYAWAECLVLRAQQHIHQGNYILGGSFMMKSKELLEKLFTVNHLIEVDATQDAISKAVAAARSDLSPKSRNQISRVGAADNDKSPSTRRIITPLDCELLRLSSSVHYDFGRLQMAEQDLLVARKNIELQVGKTPLLGDVLVELARLRLNQSKLNESKELCQNALYCYKDLVQENDPRVGMAKVEFGNVLSMKADYVQAREHCMDGLKILLKACGPKHRDVGRARLVLGELYINIREDSLALNELRQCIQVLEDCHGPNHVYVCRAIGVYSRALANLCKFDEANERLEHADKQMVKFMRDGDSDNGITTKKSTSVDTNITHVAIIVDFACLYFEEARYDETHDLLMRAMPLARVLVGKEHFITQRILQMMGKLHGTLAQYSQAHDSFETSTILARNIFSKDHPNLFRASLCDAQVYLLQGNYVQTHVRLKELRGFEPLPSPVDSANLRLLEGEFQLCLGRHKKAVDLMMSALSMLNARYREKPMPIKPTLSKAVEFHLLCAWAGCRVGNALMEWERWSDAEIILSSARDAFAIFDRKLLHPRLGDILWRHALCLHKLGLNNSDLTTATKSLQEKTIPKYRTEKFVNQYGIESARTLSFRKIDTVENDVCRDEMILAKEIMDGSLGPKHPRFAELAVALAEYHSKAGLDLWSKNLYEKACDIRRTMFGRVHPMTASSLVGLSKTFSNMSQWEKMHAAALDATWIWEQLSNGTQPEEDDEDKEVKLYGCEDEINACLNIHPHRFKALCAVAFAVGRRGSDTIMEGIEMTKKIIKLMEENNLGWTQMYQDALSEKETLQFRAESMNRYPIHKNKGYSAVTLERGKTHEYFRQRITR